MALIGDAAHRLHPLAGQGLNVGITDCAYLANAIIDTMKSGGDIGGYHGCLKEYETNAKRNAYAVSGMIEFIKNSYEHKLLGSEILGSVLGLARNTAIELLDSSNLAKFNMQEFAYGTFSHPQSYEWNKLD